MTLKKVWGNLNFKEAALVSIVCYSDIAVYSHVKKRQGIRLEGGTINESEIDPPFLQSLSYIQKLNRMCT